MRRLVLASLIAALTTLAALNTPASADPASDLAATRARIAANKAKEGVLSTTIAKLNGRVRALTRQVATLRNREAAVQDDLDRKQAQLQTAQTELRRERAHLAELRARLKRAIGVLEQRLIAIYEAGTPDVVTVILSSDGFDDLIDRTEYLNRIQNGDSALVGRVRELRNETERLVAHLTDVEARIHKARDQIAAQRAALARTRGMLQTQQGALSSARSAKQSALGSIHQETERLEQHEIELEGRVRSFLGSSTGIALPAGPVRNAGGGFIWPVNGPVVSGFGMRWGRLHAGIDIAAGTGTGIRAAKGGVVALASPYGGYGNYTCINHGGGLATCYAHQTSIGVSSGQSVSQGQVIGTVGCTGHCFGPHLHFEVRVNGVPQDPMGYL
jgi:murein DD-endopeptidase MepM/ murein hydrolase activator NlpD